MDAATVGVISTGVLGLAGIVATFFAPTWTERTLDRRREARAFRRAQRLVANELSSLHASFSAAIKHDAPPTALPTLTTGAWEAERSVLAESLPDDLWVEHQHALRDHRPDDLRDQDGR